MSDATVHIRKLCVGAQTVDDLKHWQQGRLKQIGKIWHTTRTWPRRHAEILEGKGSLYWIIKGVMCCRQEILAFEPEDRRTPDDPDEKPYCRLVLSPEMVLTDPWPHRPFQGWRYLKQDDAPPDLKQASGGDELPPDLALELRAIGAW